MASPLLRAAQSAIKAATALGATTAASLRRTVSEYDPATGATATIETDYPWVGVLESYTTQATHGGASVSGGVITSNRKWTAAAADLPVTPDPETDRLVIDNVTYRITPSAKQDPSGSVCVLDLLR
jgi:hypothetical protein